MGLQDLNSILPSSVVVVFPQYFCTKPSTPPNPLTTRYALTVPIPSGLGFSGNGNEKVIHDTANAYFTKQGDKTPLNQKDLQALANQIATDYFDWLISSFDTAYVGVMPWLPNALADEIVWTYNTNPSTRISSAPPNDDPEEYQHDTCDCSQCPAGTDAYGTSCDCPEGYYSGTLSVVTGFTCGTTLKVASKSLTISCGVITNVQ